VQEVSSRDSVCWHSVINGKTRRKLFVLCEQLARVTAV